MLSFSPLDCLKIFLGNVVFSTVQLEMLLPLLRVPVSKVGGETFYIHHDLPHFFVVQAYKR